MCGDAGFDVGDCETDRLESCRPRLSASIPPRADCARPWRGGRLLCMASTLLPSCARSLPTLPVLSFIDEVSDRIDPVRRTRASLKLDTLNLREKKCAAVSSPSPSSGSSPLSTMDAREEMDMERVGVDPNRNVVCGEPTYCMSVLQAAAPSMRAPKRISRVLNRVGWFIGEPRVPRWVDAASFLECPRARTEQPGRVPCVSGM